MRPLPIRIPLAAEICAVLAVVLTVLAVDPARAQPPLDRVMGAVFTVHSAGVEDRFLGSAFLWGAGEVAVTNAHVVGDADQVRLTDAAGGEQVGLVIARDAVRDVAVIAVAQGAAGLPVGPPPALGAEVWAFGAPLGIEFSVTAGRVSALARQIEVAVPIRMIQHDAAVNPGSSGGPLVDDQGRLVGMNAQIANGSRMYVGIAYAISGADLARIVEGLIAETLPPVAQLGLTLRPVDRQIAAALAVPVGGVLVDAVDPAGRAALLQAGDILLAVDGVALAGPGDLAFAIEAAQARGCAALTLRRGGGDVVTVVDLTPPPDALPMRDAAAALRVQGYTLAALGIALAGGQVSDIADPSPAFASGVAMGDVVLTVNGGPPDPVAVIDGPVLLLVRAADGRTRHVMIDPFAKPGMRAVGGANVLDPDVAVF